MTDVLETRAQASLISRERGEMQRVEKPGVCRSDLPERLLMPVNLWWDAVCAEDARVVCSMGAEVCSPPLVPRGLR